jgi:hypothetical protein
MEFIYYMPHEALNLQDVYICFFKQFAEMYLYRLQIK